VGIQLDLQQWYLKMHGQVMILYRPNFNENVGQPELPPALAGGIEGIATMALAKHFF
jgi:hypothetical protein